MRHRRHSLGFATALLACGAAQGAPALAGGAVTVEQPRAPGHVVGDLLTQRVLLERAGKTLDPAELPGAARIGLWLERRPGRIETAADGRRWLALDYQVINAPREMRAVELPAFEVATADGRATLEVPAWPLVVSPMSLSEPEKAGMPMLQADHEAPTVALEPLRRRLLVWAVATLLLLAAWPSWLAWRNWRAASALPFASAWRSLRRSADTDPQAWQALHRAFDAAAGRAVHSASLASLFRRAPQLEVLRPEIEGFYRDSATRFFGDSATQATVSPRALCAACRRIEKRHER